MCTTMTLCVPYENFEASTSMIIIIHGLFVLNQEKVCGYVIQREKSKHVVYDRHRVSLSKIVEAFYDIYPGCTYWV